MQTMKLLILLVVALASCASALVPSSGRRTFLAKAPATAAALIATSVAAPAFAYKYVPDEYVATTAVAKPEKKSGGGGGMAVGGVLLGGLALSLPFFLPNLQRMAGVNNAKNPLDKRSGK
jgi:hypothetical protein